MTIKNPFKYFKTSPEIIRLAVMYYVGIVRRNRLEADGGLIQLALMTRSNPFCYFKTSPEIIRLVVMMYVRFPLSLGNRWKTYC